MKPETAKALIEMMRLAAKQFAGYHMWCLNSDVDKHSLKLGMENEAKKEV